MALVLAKTMILSLGLNYGVHYTSTRLYTAYCIPHEFSDIVKSLMTTSSPMCSMLLRAMTATQTNYASVLAAALRWV
jgi:hypothetical protein